jgi:hypothetical protein
MNYRSLDMMVANEITLGLTIDLRFFKFIIIWACMGLNGKTTYIPLNKFIFQLLFLLELKK